MKVRAPPSGCAGDAFSIAYLSLRYHSGSIFTTFFFFFLNLVTVASYASGLVLVSLPYYLDGFSVEILLHDFLMLAAEREREFHQNIKLFSCDVTFFFPSGLCR